MKIVVDTNILFSFFWENSITRRLLTMPFLELISPQIAFEELKRYSKEIISKAKISSERFKQELNKLTSVVKFIEKKEYSDFIEQAKKISPDKDDTEFFALCLKYSGFLWSRDSLLKNQNKIKVLSTNDLIEILF